MELRQLAMVVAVAEEGGFTAAAQRLRTVQSTVSTVVRALERDLGTPLFDRTTHRVVLTPAGEAFVPAARAALEAAERARAAVSPVTGRVRLGVCPGSLADLHRVLAKLRQAHPGLAVEVRQLPDLEARRAVAESIVDLALTLAPNCSGDADAAGSGPDARDDIAVDGSAPGSAAAPTTFGDTATSTTPTDSPTEPAAPIRTPTATSRNTAADAPPHRSTAEDDVPTCPRAATGTTAAAQLVTTLLRREELVLVTAPRGSPSVPADLADLSLVDFPAGWAIRAAVDRAFPGRRVCLEVDDLAVAAGLVRAGLAACVLPASVAGRFGDLTVRRFERAPSWQLAAVHRAGCAASVGAVLAQLG